MSTTPIRTAKELADLCERDKGTVTRWMKRPDWTFGRPPWPAAIIPEILRWVAHVLTPAQPAQLPDDCAQPADADDPNQEKKDAIKQSFVLKQNKTRQEIRKISAAAELLETQLSRERGELFVAAEVEQQWTAVGVRIRNAFQNLPSQILPLALTHGMPHEASASFEQQVTEIVAGILRCLSQAP